MAEPPYQRYQLGGLQRMGSKRYLIPAQVAGENNINFLVSTGTDQSVVSRAYYQAMHNPPPVQQTNAELETLAGSTSAGLGRITLRFSMNGRKFEWRFEVVDILFEDGVIGGDFLNDVGAQVGPGPNYIFHGHPVTAHLL